MEPFFADLWNRFLESSFLEGVRKKYHYQESQLAELRAVGEEMLPPMQRDACWERREREPLWEEVVMTLGQGVDDLQDSYTQRGRLSECYMLEVLASELLLQGYGAYNRYIREHMACHVARYHFLGSEEGFTLERLPLLLKNFSVPVSCNEAFCLLPRKSVVFAAELTRDERIQCRGICVDCSSRNCPSRLEDGSRLKELLLGMTDLPLN